MTREKLLKTDHFLNFLERDGEKEKKKVEKKREETTTTSDRKQQIHLRQKQGSTRQETRELQGGEKRSQIGRGRENRRKGAECLDERLRKIQFEFSVLPLKSNPRARIANNLAR
ncbi:hypothetical protein CDAR_46951 [Caerostris darwini]|uniref:Uncharacterized protein n=1 Tax=Caerostris darwini TaxID=1538125 RepID=A0AAV4SA85_9ARAC|nr:hypothetical protein CDAR_46951 [Caerostris darwini]